MAVLIILLSWVFLAAIVATLTLLIGGWDSADQ
jgi:hypothetical protein